MAQEDDADIAAMQRMIDGEKERRRRERLRSIGGALRLVREGLGATLENAAYRLRMSVRELRQLEDGDVRLDAYCLADHLHALLETEGVPRRGAACMCRGAPRDHDGGCPFAAVKVE